MSWDASRGALSAIVAVAVTTSAVVVTSSLAGPASSDVTCGGKIATISGTPGNDLLVGTDGPDVIAGLRQRHPVRWARGR